MRYQQPSFPPNQKLLIIYRCCVDRKERAHAETQADCYRAY
ncbi:hypothetical protein [Scytonema sp. HK-05]|nr:hypothetical protein [Scytonema sp. HK-05]